MALADDVRGTKFLDLNSKGFKGTSVNRCKCFKKIMRLKIINSDIYNSYFIRHSLRVNRALPSVPGGPQFEITRSVPLTTLNVCRCECLPQFTVTPAYPSCPPTSPPSYHHLRWREDRPTSR